MHLRLGAGDDRGYDYLTAISLEMRSQDGKQYQLEYLAMPITGVSRRVEVTIPPHGTWTGDVVLWNFFIFPGGPGHADNAHPIPLEDMPAARYSITAVFTEAPPASNPDPSDWVGTVRSQPLAYDWPY
ncbi:hypothetical protein [Bryocella elongata]|uniref:hypothetical protein n=1 Tax=Bryocella elongata TaxID=863522 RepID=UPI0011B09143|nr:hypothetical protein [Bryocella elongata]